MHFPLLTSLICIKASLWSAKYKEGESMSETRQKERNKVRTFIEEYFKRKSPKLSEISGHKKVLLGSAVSVYIVNVKVEGWDSPTYALVSVSHSFPQGMILLNSAQLDLVNRSMKDEIDEPL